MISVIEFKYENFSYNIIRGLSVRGFLVWGRFPLPLLQSCLSPHKAHHNSLKCGKRERIVGKAEKFANVAANSCWWGWSSCLREMPAGRQLCAPVPTGLWSHPFHVKISGQFPGPATFRWMIWSLCFNGWLQKREALWQKPHHGHPYGRTLLKSGIHVSQGEDIPFSHYSLYRAKEWLHAVLTASPQCGF